VLAPSTWHGRLALPHQSLQREVGRVAGSDAPGVGRAAFLNTLNTHSEVSAQMRIIRSSGRTTSVVQAQVGTVVQGYSRARACVNACRGLRVCHRVSVHPQQ
jgi:hypothetical protein